MNWNKKCTEKWTKGETKEEQTMRRGKMEKRQNVKEQELGE